MANVLFSKLTQEQFNALTPKPDDGTFYRVARQGGEDLYLGSQKLNNAQDVVDAIQGLAAVATSGDADDVSYSEEQSVKDVLDVLLGGASDNGSVAKMIADAVAALTGSATIATVANDVVTLKAGLTETGGIVANSNDADITLAKVAKTGAAEDVSVADAGSNFTGSTVEAVLAELVTMIGGTSSDANVSMEESNGTGNILKVYDFYQGLTGGEDAATKASKKFGTINIPKDLVAVSGSVVTATTENPVPAGANGADVTYGTYIMLTIENGDPFYIDVTSLIEYVTGGETTEINVAVDSTTHVVTATVKKISASKIITVEADATNNVEEETLATAIANLKAAVGTGGSVDTKISTAINALDADLDASGTAANSGVFVVSGVTEVDGVLTAVDSVEVEQAGAAAAVLGTASDPETANTVYGLKAKIENVASGLVWNEVE